MSKNWPGIFALLVALGLSAEAQTLEFDSELYTVNEGAGTVTLTVIKTGPATGPISVHYATENRVELSFATPGSDYTPTSGDLTFAPNETSKQFTVPILEDTTYEDAEVFRVILSNPTGGAAVRDPAIAQVTIIENDAQPRVQFSSPQYSASENHGFATLVITKIGATERSVTAHYKTRDGTATAPSDYTFTGDDLTASVFFEPSETSKTIQIPLNDDSLVESSETFEVFFTVVVNAEVGTPATSTVTIHDDDPQGSHPPVRALNISTRAHVLTGDRVMIGGFIVTGNDSKRVVLRALGPSLIGNGVPSNAALLDPVFQLNRADGTAISTNDNWKDDPANVAQITGTPYEPKDDREAVIMATLPAGSYTAFVRGKGQAGGIALAEVYDVNPEANAELANLSTRGYVGMENDVMIGGFILGHNPGAVRIAIRGLGPSLANAALNGVLPDPALVLVDENANVIAHNDDWETDPVSATQLTANGLALPSKKESGIFLSLPPGQFTAVMTGKHTGVGLGLIEIYNLK
jgi:Calx-beta domain